MGTPYASRYTSVADWERLPSRQVNTNGIKLKVTEHGEGPLVILCHGFPELGFSWRHQVFDLARAGYRVIAPDMRGYGGSSRPEDPGAYDIRTLAGDLTGLLDELNEDRAVFVGHDWGANVVWNLALAHPDRVTAVAGLSVPISPRPPVPPIEVLRQRFGDDFYIVWFQEPGIADRVLRQNVPAVLLADDIRASTWRQEATPTAATLKAARPWLSEEEFQVFVRAFAETGFTGGLNYYRNIDRNWEQAGSFGKKTIDCPSLFIAGSEDLVTTYMSAKRLPDVLTDLRGRVVLDGAGHWIQQERPAEVSGALITFLGSLA